MVAGHLLGLALTSTDILPDAEGGRGHTNFIGPGRMPPDANYLERLLTTFAAGLAAEARAGPLDLEGSGWDRDQAIRRWAGYLAPPGPEQETLLAHAAARASRLLESPGAWRAVEAVAAALLERTQLTAEEAAGIVDGALR